MRRFPLARDMFWLIFGIVCLAVSGTFFLYDRSISREELIASVQDDIQEDFLNCITAYTQGLSPDPNSCIACELSYFDNGKLDSWTQNQYLPSQDYLEDQNKIDRKRILDIQGRLYYQLRVRRAQRSITALIPLYIDYKVYNDFLPPYTYLGRWREQLNPDQQRALNFYTKFPSGQDIDADIYIRDASDNLIFAIGNLPLTEFRKTNRLIILLGLFLAIFSLGVWLRYFLLEKWKSSTLVNSVFILIVLFVRMLIYWTGLPGNYVNIELFSPSILAFQDLAPSLGEFTLNVITLAVIVWLLYQIIYRPLSIPYRKLLQFSYLSWVASLLTIALSSALLWGYYAVFRVITINSQIELEFSNIFKTSIYSYLILLDMGLILFSAALIILALLKFNVLLGQKNKFSWTFWSVQILFLIAVQIYLFYPSTGFYPASRMVVISIIGLGLLFINLYRIRTNPFQEYDIFNYVLVLGAFATVVTFNVIAGVEFNNQVKIEAVGKQVLEQEIFDAIIGFRNSFSQLEGDRAKVEGQRANQRGNGQYAKWLLQNYFDPNFRGLSAEMFVTQDSAQLYEQASMNAFTAGKLELDRYANEDSVVLNRWVRSQGRDMYTAEFLVQPIDQPATYCILKLTPSEKNTQGLYPALTMDREIFEELRQIDEFDHALYRNGLLFSKIGDSEFPIRLENHLENYSNIRTSFTKRWESYMEFVSPDGEEQIAIVRYKRQGPLDILTTLSIVFYFFTFSSLILIALPLIIIRWLSGRMKGSWNIPLRSQIRLGLLSMSLVPLPLIILSLYPFVEERYKLQTEADLIETVKKIKQAIEFDYTLYQRGGVMVSEEFTEHFNDLSNLVVDDVNIYDATGRMIASSQQQIFSTGVTTNLMDAKAYEALRNGEQAEFVHEETIGELNFFSAYLPMMGGNEEAIGYVNVPYLGKQDQLNERVLDFIAYVVNIYLLIFLLFNFVAVGVSNTLTKSLRLIQNRISSTRFGSANTKIEYAGSDEIGGIVKAYNSMLDKLVESEEKLKQNQRELAWKQMARQVAHEIKNPLTPMKLNIQHLNRAYKEESKNLESMFPRVVKTLLAQIDALTRIANSFSEFAKLPDPIRSRTSVNDVLLEVIDLYAQSEKAEWLIDIPEQDIWAEIDRDQLGRCFQNIIKNGLQAIEDKGIMRVGLRMNGNQMCVVSIRDNGKGMTEEVQKRVFEPNFSTKSSGMGLGLAMVKRMIENSGGLITFESKQYEGTTFFIELPISA